ncbi:MAG TPA: deoxyribodipyrimidine photo-lyase, partial [Chitinophagales bacterium]|nr:deoxyribodipyrimidine photo-lyase [Chitinophagales bacterium]
MSDNTTINVFWFRRDLRLDDNAGLYHALKAGKPVLALFIFDTEILDKLENKADLRVQFIRQELLRLNEELAEYGSSLLVKVGKPLEVWKGLLGEYSISTVYTNRDYEPYAAERDEAVNQLLKDNGAVRFHTYKDIVIFEKHEVVKDDKLPYIVFTPYSRKWKEALTPFYFKSYPTSKYADKFLKVKPFAMPSISDIGFVEQPFDFPPRVVKSELISKYTDQRDFPAIKGTSHLGLHLRFGTLS